VKIQLKNRDFKKLLRFFDENPSWLGEYSSKDSNGEYITYGQSGMQSCTKDDFATDKISTHRIQDGSIKINDYAWARLWDGTPQTYNSYD